MANLSESYDKVSLVVSIVIAAALGAMIWMAKGNVEEDFRQPSVLPDTDAPENPKQKFYADTT